MIQIRRLVWDDWNVAHIIRHDVAPEEVEEVCNGEFIARGSYEGRVMLIGPTSSNRMLALVLAPRENGIYYTVTARPASRKERRLYQDEEGNR